MKKQKTRKELERDFKEIRIMIGLMLIGILILGFYGIYKGIEVEKLQTQLSECQEQVPITCENLPRMISDSCVIGCIYSTKFYYNNSEINLKDASYECMMYCLSKSYEISNQICEVEK